MKTNRSIALLLEDEPLISMDIEMTLEAAGFDVATVMSSADANAWLDGNAADVAIVDIMLRDGRCDEFVSRLEKAGVPFVVHSGDLPGAYDGTPFAQGVCLNKPAQAEELVATLTKMLAS